MFLGYYIIEMFVFLRADGWHASFTDRWFCFDVLLVSIAILSQWVSPILVLLSGGGDVEGLEKALIVRILRLVRPLRALRVIDGFKDLWKLISGLGQSARTVLNACLLIFATLYVFALLAVELVGKDPTLLEDDTTSELVRHYFDSVLGSLLTLVQFANADSIAGLYDPLIRAQPGLALYFVAVWIVVTILLMNLVTAVVIQNAIECGVEDAEAQTREKRARLEKLVPLLSHAFEEVDTSRDGVLAINEVTQLCNVHRLPKELREIMRKDRMLDIFRCLDSDETGDVSKEEFIRGICHIAMSDIPFETTQILAMLRAQGKLLDKMYLNLPTRWRQSTLLTASTCTRPQTAV
jgi:hypothetical protein